MKVRIGKYPNRLRCTIHDRYMNKKYGYVDWPMEQTRFENFLEWLEDTFQSVYNLINVPFLDKRQQKVKVRIDPWDTWSMDHTLAPIILPMLVQLKATKHGSPDVNDKDVPKHLRSTSAPPKENDWDIDDNWHKRWEWVMDEMIWAFEQKNLDDFTSDYNTKHFKRMSNGFRLFGKYYENLWD